jgi:hypothetical protein
MDFDDTSQSSSSSSSSSDSDDDFLTSTGGGQSNALSREALVRKKLLESFYGASAAVDVEGSKTGHAKPGSSTVAPPNDSNGDDDDEKLFNDQDEGYSGGGEQQPMISSSSDIPTSITHPSSSATVFRSPSQIPLPFTATKSDLDSPNFNPENHTLSHIAHSSAHTLLETNERLALDIRTLDSTMQTLVYENYSKFIDATDAIKSIGTNVTTAESGLDRLDLGMERIAQASARSDQLLRASREAVAEKLRIQRLLTRLDALLCLPKTLRRDISEKKHRKAVKSYKNATEILGRHSAGFESLRSIEAECGEILKELAEDLKKKLLWWGQAESGISALSQSSLPPSSIAEIFESAGTLLMLEDTTFSPGLNRIQCQSLALSACTQFLKERLDPGRSVSFTPINSLPNSPTRNEKEAIDSDDDSVTGIISELPIAFLDGLLEATTLYGVSFPIVGDKNPSYNGSELIGSFVENNFGSFIEQVRRLLIRRSESYVQPLLAESKSQEEEELKDDANFIQVSLALSYLLRSVRELASGLALPEVGMDLSIASALVDQTVELAEMLVRVRIGNKFKELRGLVLKECLAPLVKEVTQADKVDPNEDSRPSSSLVEMIQLSSVALSDGLQMADDLIRATLQQSQATKSAAPVDSAVVKLAVQKNARLFGIWLATSLEQLAGCEPSEDDKVLLEIHEEENAEDTKPKKKIALAGLETDGESNCQIQDGMILSSLLVQLDEEASDQAYSNFLLALCEMCRLAERNIANTLNSSIQSAMEEDARVAESANTLFGDTINPHRKGKDGLDVEHILSKRFQLAASRVLSMYILDRGAHAAAHLCTGMPRFADARDPYAIPTRPREDVLRLFDVVKASCEDLISIVGGDLFAVAVPPFPDEIDYANVFGDRLSGGSGGGTTSGLKMDVERMFIENIQVYPHAFDELEFTRNSVISGILRVALSALVESVRSSVFSSLGLRQMKVDAVFLRYLVPHYVKDVYGTPEANACTGVCNAIDDVMLNAGQRCVDPEVIGDDEYYDAEKDEIVTPFQLVQHFLVNNDGDGNVIERISFSY